MQISEIKNVFKKPYTYWLSGIFILYITIAVVISQFYITVQYIPRYLDTIKWTELAMGVILTLIIAILVATNSVFLYIKYNQRKNTKKPMVITSLGTIGGFAGGVCSACVSGLFPFIFALFGVTFTWTFLPFNGLEVQGLSIVLLSLSLYFLAR